MTDPRPDAGTEFERGHAAGEIAARLAGHDKHFADINGSIRDLAGGVHGLNLAVQRMIDEARARDERVIATAVALKEAEDARRDAEEEGRKDRDRRWSPWSKLFAILAGIAAAVTVAGVIYSLLPKGG